MSPIDRPLIERFLFGKIKDPAELERVLNHLQQNPQGEAARFLEDVERLAQRAFDINWSALIDDTRGKIENTLGADE